jgi:hypothetical protein
MENLEELKAVAGKVAPAVSRLSSDQWATYAGLLNVYSDRKPGDVCQGWYSYFLGRLVFADVPRRTANRLAVMRADIAALKVEVEATKELAGE